MERSGRLAGNVDARQHERSRALALYSARSWLLWGALAAVLLPAGVDASERARVLRDVENSASTFIDSRIDYFEILGDRLVILGGGRTAHGIWSADRNGGPARLLSAVPEETANSNPRPLATNGQVLVVQENDGYQVRIRVTDGTEVGTRVLMEAGESPAWVSGAPLGRNLAPGGQMVFLGLDDAGGLQLWATEGTRESIRQLTYSTRETSPTAWPGLLFPVGDEVFYLRPVVGSDCEIWVTDGTPGGTRQAGLAEGISNVREAWPGDDKLFVWFDDYYGPDQLWVSDGTTEGTRRVELPEEVWGPDELATRGRGAIAFFIAETSAGGEEVWRTDGTTGGTYPVTSFDLQRPVFDWNAHSLVMPNGLLFSAREESGGPVRLWFARADGTSFAPLLDLEPPGGTIAGVVSATGRGVFLGSSPATGIELWSTDGSAAGTFPLTEVGPGSLDAVFTGASAVGERLLLAAALADGDRELWITDPEGTTAGPVALFASGNIVLRGAELPRPSVDSEAAWVLGSEGAGGYQVWECPLNASGKVVRTRFGRSASTSLPLGFSGREGLQVFDACAYGLLQLWASDGESVGTQQLPIWGGSCPSSDLRRGLWRASWPNGDVLLNWNAGSGQQIYRLDEQRALLQLTDFPAGALGLGIRVDEAFVYPRTFETGSSVELWRTEVASASSQMFALLDEPPHPRWASVIAPFDGGGILLALDLFLGREAWWTDGTAGGTYSLGLRARGIYPSTTDWRPVALGGELFFAAYEGDSSGLFRYRRASGEIDRLTPPELRVRDRTYEPMRVGDHIATIAEDESGWLLVLNSTIDGTLTSTRLPGSAPASGQEPGWATAGESILFSWSTEDGGAELWVADATDAGPRPLADIEPGPFSSAPTQFVSTSQGVFFTAFDHRFGRELWRSDGTAEGTLRVGDLAPGAASSSPQELAEVGGRLFFSAYREELGREPWTLDFASSFVVIFADDFESLGTWNWDVFESP
ncbi:MAG: hypothetical protein H6511_00255 [Holophagales bacterium]|nr:hypothetical protein [Holophagales bacterium]